jgi:dye decolorizing peroxidase
MSEVSRRELLAGTAAAAVGGAVAAGLGLAAAGAPSSSASFTSASSGAPGTSSAAVEPFYGEHQAGIATRPQSFGTFIGLDLAEGTGREQIVRMLRLLADDAARLTQGRPALGDTEPELALAAARLTVTAGFGPRLFDLAGISADRPPSVRDLPAFPGDKLQSRWGQSDLLLQVCTDNPTTMAHAVRMLVKDARSFGPVRWAQRGFTAGGATENGTARNLMGQVDGTVNPVAGTPDFDRAVWATQPGWFTGGSVLVLRRIAMNLETWDAFERPGKEQVIGRRLDTGAPMTGTVETDVPDLDAVDAQGFPVIEPLAHIRLAKAQTPAETMLRRAFSYDDGMDAAGRADAGLLFVAYQADADTAFVPVQRRLAERDLFNKWITHIGSAVYAVPPGIAEGGYWGRHVVEG